ncbi:hypothetical protein [Rheinheimera mangrovi]|uniref:hypothetical protein n=1 Tax=Rheinheimera mangrovi TaxID=2498451 RepID=UPI000F8D586A|nr:hypothetical protein [Rheinheimera mangrovi]
MTTTQPTDFSKDLTIDRLETLCECVLDTVRESQLDASSPNDTAWTKGCLSYGRLQGLMKRLAIDKDYPWLTLANNTMDFTAKIGSTYIQFIVDDAFSPKKTHRLKTNALENMQISLDLEDNNQTLAVVWRIFVGLSDAGVGVSPSATLIGFDINQNPLCIWQYETVSKVPMGVNVVEPSEIEEPVVTRKIRKNDDNLANGT